MSMPFFESGAQRLHEVARPGVLCAFDFDGTLAPVVKEPGRACVPSAVSRRLTVLSEHAHVAILTGRSLEDVGARLDFLPDFVVGNHGIEGTPGWEERAGFYQQLCEQWVVCLEAALRDRKDFDPAIWVENKTYSLTVHYRMAENRPQAELRLLELFAAALPSARVTAGKCAFNLLPPDAPDKGAALQALCEAAGAQTAIYVGDNATDENVYRMRRPEWLTVRIEQSADSAAEFYLNHRLDMVPFLDTLIEKLCEIPVSERRFA